MNASRLNWGLIFIIIGLVLLGWSTGRLPFEVIVRLLELWPVLLIAIGIQMIFNKSKVPQFAYISSLLIIGAAIYAVAPNWDNLKYRDARITFGSFEQEISAPVSALEINAEFTNREFIIDDYNDDPVALAYDHEQFKPQLEFLTIDTLGKVVIKSFDNEWYNRLTDFLDIFKGYEQAHWKLRLSRNYPLNLVLKSRESYCYLRMKDLNIRSIDLDCEECDEVVLQFGLKVPEKAVMLDLHRSRLRLEIPDDIDIMIKDGAALPFYLTDDLDYFERGDDLFSDSVISRDSLLILDIGSGLSGLEINRY